MLLSSNSKSAFPYPSTTNRPMKYAFLFNVCLQISAIGLARQVDLFWPVSCCRWVGAIAEWATSGIRIRKKNGDGGTSPFSLPDPTLCSPAISIVLTDWPRAWNRLGLYRGYSAIVYHFLFHLSSDSMILLQSDSCMSQSFQVLSTKLTNQNIDYSHYSNQFKLVTFKRFISLLFSKKLDSPFSIYSSYF